MFTDPKALQILKEEQVKMDVFFQGMDARIAKAHDYQVKRADGTIVNAGTDLHSWFTLDEARETAKPGDTVLYLGYLETL